jgi:natural product biosynthesis luciferase-like monooxygenase protein
MEQERVAGVARSNGHPEQTEITGSVPLDRGARLTQVNDGLARHESYWVGRLAALETVELPYANRSGGASGPVLARRAWPVPPHLLAGVPGGDPAGDFLAAAFALYLARLAGRPAFDLGFSHPALRRDIAGLEGFFAAQVPLRVAVDPDAPVAAGLAALRAALATARRRRTYVRDVVVRYPQLSALRERSEAPSGPVQIELAERPADVLPVPGSELTFAVAPDGTACEWHFAPGVYSADDVAAMQEQFAVFVSGLLAAGDAPLRTVSLLSDGERHRLLVDWNATATPYPRDACVHTLIAAQAARTPAAVAAVFEGESITYAELDGRANQVAHYLSQRGVGPDSIVGVYMERSIELLVGLLGIHKAGGAYLPLDPTYPRDRLDFMVEDAGVRVLLTQAALTSSLPRHQTAAGRAEVIRLDADWAAVAAQPSTPVDTAVAPHHLAYVIYTSGSTGKPKGVMVEHRNAVNFFAGMDARLDGEPAGTWLAVTSLSFDISVLELFWTLARGFKVVIYGGSDRNAELTRRRTRAATRGPDFSLFYFASDEGADSAADKYRLLLEGARFADRNGFAAVWTPERHFHAFGGLYPNPSVAGAAIAAVTERVQIRAGSVVSPLHHPIRIAEEWALVDNLSQGRVGISFAAGWQPNDFVLAPQNFADRKAVMVEGIETIKRLWRGETVEFPGPKGDAVAVRTLPRPVQPELPTWVTVAGNPESYRMAGELGAGVLTHLLGQTVEELAQKLTLYREARRAAGHPGEGHVVLMLHTFVGDDEDAVREAVKEPMKGYLRSSVDLIKAAAWSFPAFKNRDETTGQSAMQSFDASALDEATMDALLDHAFNRYYGTSGLFGTPESCRQIVDRVRAIGVDEVACLIDFGVPSASALEHLDQLNRLRELCQTVPDAADAADAASAGDAGDADYSIPALIERHEVTHLQCTPSMAGMLVMDGRTREAMHRLRNVMVGGEALPATLATQLQSLIAGDVINMYGPTETTIWSSTYRLPRGEPARIAPPIGRPIANTGLYILDADLQPVPTGVPGELFIGGDGVVRGYLNRPELTAERFVDDPFSTKPGARLYRTGDLARWRRDGNVDFLGRLDHQVKIRGYRIELGEIESQLLRQPVVREAVVIAREDAPGDRRLVAYVVPRARGAVDTAALRNALKEALPDYMVPAHVVALDAFPLTPNAKVDRKALPAPDAVAARPAPRPAPAPAPPVAAAPAAAHGANGSAAPRPAPAAPAGGLEETVVRVWLGALNVPQVGLDDNFFDLGGHSLLMVQVQQQLQGALGRELSITDLFRFPTIRSLTEHLGRAAAGAAGGGAAETPDGLRQTVERAEARREMMLRRRGLRP